MANTLISLTRTPTLTWAAIAGATQYQVQFSADQRFRTLEQNITALATPTVTPSALTDAAKHYWRFRALLSATLYTDQSNTTGAGTGTSLRAAAANTYLSQGFVHGAGFPVKRVILSLKKTGTPTGNIWVEIWTSSGGSPSAITGSASANVDVSTLTGAYANYNFDFTTQVPLTQGTSYFIVLRGDFAIDGANYALWQTDAAASYTNGAAYTGTAVPVWSSSGSVDQIFTVQFNRWDTWQPIRALVINTASYAAYTPNTTGWAFIDPDYPLDYYNFDVAPHYQVDHVHQRRSQGTNILGDLLTEYVSTRDRITLTFDSAPKSSGAAYLKYDQLAEVMRFFHKRKSVYLTAVTDYIQDKHERIWKVDFIEQPQVTPLAAGREDLFVVVLLLQESVLT